MRTLKKFVGINNVSEREDLRDNELSVASNVDIDLNAKARRRAGYSSASAVKHANVWKAKSFTLATRGVDGDLVNIDDDTVLWAGFGHERVRYWNLPGGRVLFSNGALQGIADVAAAKPWGVPIPASVGTAIDMAGQLHAGAYQWAVTHSRVSDGLEGGPLYGEDTVEVSTGGVLFSDLPVLAGYRTNIYLTSHNGGERYLAGSTTTDSFMFTGANSDLQQRLLTADMQPPPVGTFVAFWRGRTLVSVGNVLYASQPHSWELFDLQRDFKQFSAPVTLVQPVNNGIWIGTEKELVFLGGDTWDKLTRDVKEPSGVTLGSGVQVPGTSIRYRDGRADGDCMVCICDGWLVAGLGDGTLVPMSRDRYRVEAAEVSAAFRIVNDVPQYIAIEQ